MTTVYHARLYDQPGLLARVNRALTFLNSHDGSLTEVEPADCNFLTVLDAVPVPDCFVDQILPLFHTEHAHLAVRMGE